MDTTMLDSHAPTRRNRRRRALLAILLSSSVATLGAGAMSLAVFSDSDAAGGSWTTGTIALGVSPTTQFSAAGILPGDRGEQQLVITNTGTGDLRYSMASVATNADGKGLRDALGLRIYEGACGDGGHEVWNGTLANAAFGSSAQGAQAGDRTLDAGQSEGLCVAWDFPIGSGNALQAAATDATFTFASEQTKNN